MWHLGCLIFFVFVFLFDIKVNLEFFQRLVVIPRLHIRECLHQTLKTKAFLLVQLLVALHKFCALALFLLECKFAFALFLLTGSCIILCFLGKLVLRCLRQFRNALLGL